MKIRFVIIALLVTLSSLWSLDRTPRQLLFKASMPLQINSKRTGLQSFDQFLQGLQVRKISAVTQKADNRYYRVDLEQEPDWSYLESSKPEFEGIEYIQPNYLNEFYLTPNDPYYGSHQQIMDLCKMQDAWDITTGNHQVILGLVDSGVLFDHPDLQNNIFVNQQEIPGNGIDDDHNGYIDDWRGWDFADAPELSDIGLGDYTNQDNDPTDENFHGTHVAGIMAADTNNGIGIAGVCWNASILVVRAGFRTTEGSGYLQDDDAAAAVIYAADMGANVINMSWGDPKYSPIIADACQYAFNKGAILVASAGNTPTPVLSYPARLSTVISVGAIDSNNHLAGFSSYGPDLDLVAPGQDIYSTYQSSGDDIYKNQSGTSMASPFVAGAIGLLLSMEPSLTYEDVRSRLLLSCDDLGTPGFDNSFGNGLLNVYRLLGHDLYPQIQISYPVDHEGLSHEFDIRGSVSCPNFMRYSVMYTREDVPTQLDWFDVVTHSNTPAYYYVLKHNDILAHFHIPENFPDGNYKIRVMLEDRYGKKYTYSRAIRIDRTAPELKDNSLFYWVRYYEENSNYYLQAAFNENVNLTVYCRTQTNQVYEAYSITSDSVQVVQIPNSVPEGLTAIKLAATNESGLTFESDWYTNFVNLDYSSIPVHGYDRSELGAPLVTPSTVADFNNDGLSEFLGMVLPTTGYGNVYIMQMLNNEAVIQYGLNTPFWPLDIGNSNAFGKEILGLYLDTAYLFETPDDSVSVYPSNDAIWTETGISGGCFGDYDNNGTDDLILVKSLTNGRVLQLYRRTSGTPAFSPRNQLTNTTATSSRNTFVPKVICTNLDNDGFPDIIAADTDGDVMVYEVYSFNPVQQQMTWTTRLPVPNAYYLSQGDYNGDGQKDFVVGGYQKDLVNLNKTFWYFEFFTYSGNSANPYHSIGRISFDQVTSQNSITTLDVDGDQHDELVLSLSPNLYIVKFVNGVPRPIYRGTSFKTYQMTAFKDASTQDVHFIFNDEVAPDSIRSFEMHPSAPFLGPQTPENVRLTPVDATHVQMGWKSVDADYYRIYKRYQGVVSVVDSTSNASYLVGGVPSGQLCEFAVSGIKNSMTPPESQLSLWKSVTANNAPQLIQVQMISQYECRLLFDQQLSSEAVNAGHYIVEPDMGNPYSVNMISNQHGLLLRFNKEFPQIDGEFTVQVTGITGITGVPIALAYFTFPYNFDYTSPEVVSVEVNSQDSRKLRVTFSEKLQPTLATLAANYGLLLPVNDLTNGIQSVSLTDSVAEVMLLKNLEYSNQPYILVVNNVQDLSGNVISSHRNKKAFTLSDITDLSHLMIFPNPVETKQIDHVSFRNFPIDKVGKIRIYNLTGDLIFMDSINPNNNPNYTYQWKLINSSKQKVSSGMYFYVIEMDNKYKKGKLAVIH